MSQACCSLNKTARRIGATLLASSALALTVTLGSAPLAVDAFAAQAIPPLGISSKGRTFNATKPILKRYPSGSSSSAGSRVTPPPKGSGSGSRGPRKPPIIVKRHPVPPVIVMPSVPVVVGSGTGGPPSAGPGAAGSPLRRPGIGGLPPGNDRDYLPDEVVIQLAANGADQAARSLAQQFRLTQVESFDVPGANTRLYRWRLAPTDRRSAPAVVSAIEANRSTVSVSLNYIMRLYGEAPVNLGRRLSWGLLTGPTSPPAHRATRCGRLRPRPAGSAPPAAPRPPPAPA